MMGRKNTRRFSRNITVDFISCTNVNDVYDGPEILTYRDVSFSLSLISRDPSETISFWLRKDGEREKERVIVSF